MSEQMDISREMQQPAQQNQPAEKVGDIIHKERVTKRITIETIAKDLKLNTKYIKALESNNFSELPAEPYIRVYLRSIATYLMLNPDEILKKFFDDQGLSSNQEVEKLKISMGKDNQKHSLSWILIILLILILAIVSYVSNKMNWINKGQSSVMVKDTTTAFEVDSALLNEIATRADKDTAYTSIPAHDSLDILPGKDTLKLTLKAKKDTVWVQAFSDGISWKNCIRAPNSKTFIAIDSIVVNVGNNSLLKYTLNENTLDISGRGVKIFKVDHTGVTFWEMDQWKKTFKSKAQ